MQTLAFKILFRKKGTASAIIAIALLVALIASVNALVNNINSQTNVITTLARSGGSYLLTSENSSSLSDSKIQSTLIDQIKNNPNIKYVTAQQTLTATLMTSTGNYSVTIKGVDDIQAFLKNNRASINGTVSKENQANVGIILAKLSLVSKNDLLNLTVSGKSAQLNATSITQANQQIDTQITMPLSTLQTITHDNTQISYIEFTLKNPNQANSIISNLTQTLPSNIKITCIQQVTNFAQDINNQTAVFINVWSIAIYIVVMAAAYLIVARVLNESEYDLFILRTMGAKKTTTFNLILLYTLTLAFTGALIGLSLGIVGTQTIATLIRWNSGNTLLSPFLENNQVLQILSFTLIAALVGSVYPAIKATQTIMQEKRQ